MSAKRTVRLLALPIAALLVALCVALVVRHLANGYLISVLFGSGPFLALSAWGLVALWRWRPT